MHEALDLNIRRLVIGAHGQTRAESFPLGGVAEKLISFAPCSVLVAR